MNPTLTDEGLASGQVPDPFDLFTAWLADAAAAEPNDPNAMTLATVDAEGMPDARIVLLKGHDGDGFTFYTNTRSDKGVELAAAPRAALLFHWKSVRRQVRIRGAVAPVSEAEADAYFATRPRGSQLGAWASEQSAPLESRAALQARVAERDGEFIETVPRPPHWSGYRLTPRTIEFWQDGAFRLHDRFRYSRTGDAWDVRRLYP